MRYVIFRFQAAIFDFPQIHMSGSLRGSLIVKPDPENMGINVGILFPSCIEAEIFIIIIIIIVVYLRQRKCPYYYKNNKKEQYVMSFLLPVIGRQL